MNCIPQWVQNRRILLRNGGIELPDIGLRNNYILGKRAVRVHADNLHFLTNVRFAGPALQTFAARNMHFRRNKVTFFYTRDFIAKRDHFAAEFMSWDKRRMNPALCPAVPFVDVQVGATNGGNFHFHQDVSPAKAWNFDLANLRSWRGFRLNHRQHAIGHHKPIRSESAQQRLILAPREQGADSVARLSPFRQWISQIKSQNSKIVNRKS